MKLSRHDYKRIHSFYRDAFVRYGDADPRSVQWTDSFGQMKRFEVLLNVGDVELGSLLDVGCGLGDLYQFLLENNIQTDYTGIDIVPEFIDAAKKNYPGVDFQRKDIFAVKEKYDYVLASGTLSFKVSDNENFYREMIKKMYEIANKAVAFNMLDRLTHVDNETYAAYSPNEIVDFCKTFASKVEIAIDYLPQDFTVYLYK